MSELNTPEQLLWQYISTGKVSKPDAHAALVQIAKEDDPGSIYLLAGLCCDQDSAIREQSWYALARLLRHVKPQTLATIDGRMRLFRIVFHVDRVNLAEVPTHVLGLISFSFDGHVREAAVRELARRLNGDELAFLLLRLNDWVDIVRDAAFTAVQDRLQRDYANHFAANSPLLMRLWQTERHDLKLVRQRIESTLMSPAGIELLRKGLDSENPAVVKYISGLLLGEDNPDRDSDILVAIAHTNSRVRFVATEIALTTFSDSRVKALISQCLRDPFAPIRKEALRWIAERKEENWQPPLIENLFSSSGGIRELARFYLRDQDVTHIYMQALDTEDQPTSRLEATLKGLLETKAPVDIERIRRFLQHPTGSVRAAAYALLLRADKSELSQLAMGAMLDGSSRCLREARKFLLRNPTVLSIEVLWQLMSESLPVRIRKTILSSISRQNKWESLPYLLMGAALPDQDLSMFALSLVVKWIDTFNLNAVAPNQSQLERCNSAVSTYGHLLDQHRQRLLAFTIKEHSLS